VNTTITERIESLERRVAELEAENRRLWAKINQPAWTKHHEKYAAAFSPGPYDASTGGARLVRALREGTTKP